MKKGHQLQLGATDLTRSFYQHQQMEDDRINEDAGERDGKRLGRRRNGGVRTTNPKPSSQSPPVEADGDPWGGGRSKRRHWNTFPGCQSSPQEVTCTSTKHGVIWEQEWICLDAAAEQRSLRIVLTLSYDCKKENFYPNQYILTDLIHKIMSQKLNFKDSL